MNLEQILENELERFNQIGSYVKDLSEQKASEMGALASHGSGFVNPQGGAFNEQEDPEDTEDLGLDDTDTEDLPDSSGEDLDLDLDMEVSGEDTGGEDLSDESSATEIDVTDIVTMAKGAESKAGEAKDTLDSQTEKIGDLLNKLEDLSSKLDTIDTITQSIEDLEDKIEASAPETPQERLDMISLDSGPFSQKPLEYWDDKKEELDGTGKHEYVLTKGDTEDFEDTDIRQSFNEPTDEQKKDAGEEEEEDDFSVLGNKPSIKEIIHKQFSDARQVL